MMMTQAPVIEYEPGSTPVGYHRLHPDVGINFQCNRFLQLIGPDALAEIRTAASAIGTYAEWIETFLALAARAREEQRILAGAYYDRAAEFFMRPGDARRAPARARFLRDIRALYGVTPVNVPYGDAAFPAYDLAPDGPPRGTIVVTGGFDEYVEEGLPLLAATRRAGYRVIAFDGPGQGGALEDARLPLTPAWEEPVGALLDHFEVTDVTLIGISLGGGLAIRAAAFDDRVRRVVAADVLDDFLECLARQAVPGAAPALRVLLAARARPLVNLAARLAAARKPLADWGLRQGMHVTATSTPYGFFQAARALTTRSVSARVTADVLLLAGTDDHYVPSHQLHRQAAALTRARSVSTRTFTAAEQAHNHCQIGNLGAALRAVLTWLDSLAPEPSG
ncbi:alpha/beta fold hydrolase [Spirillospora sp. CA-128828]|uniref:alpha/beta fold hydrolase n=1 Tax=Spirillospora sp. CA-128828 TaxID=3240033 RepID=UPI003D916CA4